MSDLGNKEILAINLQRYMKMNHKTRRDISEELNIPYTTVTAWLNGETYPRIDKIELMANYFGINKSDLVEKIPKRRGVKIPVLGTVPCGVPIEAIEDIIDYEDINEKIAKTGTFFGLKAQGDSMYPQIIDGDTLIIKQTTTVNSGDIAIVKVNGDEATCKKVSFNDYGITLISFNSAYEPMIYSKDDIEKLPITICGKVVESKRSY